MILAWDTAALCSLVGMRDYGLAHVVLPSCKARLQSYRASVGQNTACLVVGHRGAGFMYAVRQRERVVPRRYPIFLGLLSSQTISARQQGGKGRDCSKVVCRIIGLRQGCSLFRVNHSSASRNFRCTACQKQPHPTALQTTGE